MFLSPRAHLGALRQRGLKQRVINAAGYEAQIFLPADIHPLMLMMAQLMAPGILTGRPEKDGIGSLWTTAFQFNPASLSAAETRNGISETFDAIRFAQFLAKIAHSYMAAEVHLTNVQSYLTEFIRKKFPDHCECLKQYHYVGGSAIMEAATKNVHEIGWGAFPNKSLIYCVVRIRLYANLGAPTYYVVPGHFKSLDDFPDLRAAIFSGARYS